MRDTDESRMRMRRLAPWTLGVLLVVIVGVAAMRLVARMQPPAVIAVPPMPVETAVVRAVPFESTIRYSGSIEAERRAILASHLTATVLDVGWREGALVEQGRVLVRLDDSELLQESRRLEASAERIEADLKFWREQLRADEKLFREGTVSERALQETRRQVRSLEASRQENRHALEAARTRLGYASVSAPYTGYIQKVHLLPGELATPGRALVEIVASEPLKAVLPVPERDLVRIRPGLAVRLRVASLEKEWLGQIDRLYPALDQRTRTATFETFFPPGAGVQPGMNVEAEVVIEQTPDALVVEQQAIQHRRGETGVFIVDNAVARWRPVRVTRPERGYVRLLGGVASGDRVILTPYPTLTDGREVLVNEGRMRTLALERQP